jgi:hypothetical protein
VERGEGGKRKSDTPGFLLVYLPAVLACLCYVCLPPSNKSKQVLEPSPDVHVHSPKITKGRRHQTEDGRQEVGEGGLTPLTVASNSEYSQGYPWYSDEEQRAIANKRDSKRT